MTMKCQMCNEKKGSTRCEGCDTLFCLQCMNKHHGELTEKFQQLMDIRNKLKESLDAAETTSSNENKPPCFLEIDRWERRTIDRIREVARKVRTNFNVIMAKNVTEVRHQMEQLSASMQQQEKEENYLETDMEKVEFQLQQLIGTIQHLNEKIQVITSDKVEWDTLIYVKISEISTEDSRNSTKVSLENEVLVNREPQSIRESTSRHHSDRRPVLRTTAFQPFQSDNSRSFRPITSPILSHEDSPDSERNPSLTRSFVSPARIVSMVSNSRNLFSSEVKFRHGENT